MGAPVKRKREQEEAPAASTSTQATTKKVVVDVAWPSIHSGIQGTRGEPGAVEALNQLCRVIGAQRSASASKKSDNEPSYRAWTDFLAHWQRDPRLKDVAAAWERGDASGNNNLATSALHVYANLLNVAVSPSAGLIALDSPYQATLASLIQKLIPLLHYLQKYLNTAGKNDLATASLEVIGALLKLVRHGSARNATNRKIWEALNLDARAICRLLATKRKIPLINKHGRKPDIRHLMFNVLNNLLSPSSSLSMKIDVLNQKGVISSIFKGLSEDPVEVVEAVLESMARLIAIPRLPIETRCRIAEDSWTEVLKLYARSEEERSPQSDADTPIFPPSVTAHRYLLFVITSLASASPIPTPGQRKALGSLIGLLELSDSLEQAQVAAHILQYSPDLLPSFWTKFAPSLEPRLSSKWVTSIAFATRVVASPLPDFLLTKLHQAKSKDADTPSLPNMATILDTALMPPSIGKTWISKALQQSDSVPLVTYLTCQFLMAGMQKCTAIIDCMRDIAKSLRSRGEHTSSAAWKGAASRLAVDASDRLPDLQVLIALVQKSLGRAFSRASSVASVATAPGSMEVDGENPEDDNSLMTSLALRTIYLYRRLAPSIFSKLRFDFGKLLSSPFFASASEGIAPLAAVGQSALLKIISLPADSETGEGAVSWAWSKSSDGGLSPVASIIRIYLSSPVESLRSVAEEAISSLLGSSLLFEHDASEIPIWLEALPCQEPAQLDVLVFFDGCLQRCLQTPYKYVDQMAEILSTNDSACKNTLCRQASPMLATVLEQTLYRLTREESAKPYMLFMQHLLMGLACHTQCRCLLSSVTAKLQSGLKEISGQSEAQECFVILQGLTAKLLGKGDFEALKNARDVDLLTIEKLLVLAASSKSNELNNEFLQAFKISSSHKRVQLARLAGYLLLTGQDLSKCILELLSTPAFKTNITRDLLSPILQLPEMPAFFEASAHVAAPVLDVLCHLINECGRLNFTDEALLQPYAEILARKVNPETVVRCASVVQDFTSEQLVTLLERLFDMPTTTAEEECMILACTNLSKRMQEDNVYQAVTRNAEKLYSRGQEWCDNLLAAWAEETLPSGFLPTKDKEAGSSASKTIKAASPVLSTLANRVIEDGIRSSGTARLLATATYRSSAVWQKYSATSPVLSTHPDSTPACKAYLEVASFSSPVKPAHQVLEAMLAPALAALLQKDDLELQSRARQIILLLVKVEASLIPALLPKLQTNMGQEAVAHPQRLNAGNLLFLNSLNEQITTIESFSVVEAFINASLLWVVRRFAEDEQNDDQTSGLVEGLSKCLHQYHKKWLLKPHLVEPVVTATIQSRLSDASSLAYASALVAECKLQDHVYISQMQMLLAHRRLRAVLQPGSDSRDALVELLQAFDGRATGLFGRVNAVPVLLPFYQATLSKADQGLLQLFRRAELQGGTSIRSVIHNWVPWQLRGVCTGPFQVLANLDPGLLYQSQCCVMRPKGTVVLEEAYDATADPTFYLALVSSLLEEEGITRSNWLALISSNALGLAICSLASSRKAYVIAGDRILARARNALQSAELREKDEILYLLDCVRNAVEPSTSTTSPGLPPLIALCISEALQGMSVPEGFLHPAAWRWLLSRPVVDTDEVPLFYSIFYSTADDRSVEVKWLLKTLQNGVQIGEDWRLVRRRQVVELLVDYLQSGATGVDKSINLDVLKTIVHLTKLPQAVHDLIARNGFLGSLALQSYNTAEERTLGIQIVENCVTLAQPTKLRRARDGLWLADLLRSLSEVQVSGLPNRDLYRVVNIVRCTSAHMVSGSEEAQAILKASVLSLLKQAISQARLKPDQQGAQFSADLYDAAMRLVGDMTGDLFEAATCIALDAGVKGVKEEIIGVWQG